MNVGRCLLGLLFILPSSGLLAQQSASKVDTNYISSFTRKLTARTYLSQKYSRLQFNTGKKRFVYNPNTSLNLGVGATYESVTLNLAYGFPFLNPDRGQGDTKYLDLQSHLYGRNWVTDVYGQFYKGYNLYDKSLAASNPEGYYVRPDLYVRMAGASVYYLTNGDQFSYRAAFVQSEWQKKSSGTWMIGAEMYYGSFGGETSLIPIEYGTDHPITKARFFKIGPGGGYAYTFVLNRHFFATASLTANLNLTVSSEFDTNNETETRWHARPNFNYRAVVGYNSRLWNVNVSLVNTDVSLSGQTDIEYLVQTGNVRFTVARRFDAKGKLRRLGQKKRQLLN